MSFIYDLTGGRLVEQGNHAELFALGGLYAHLRETQLKHIAPLS